MEAVTLIVVTRCHQTLIDCARAANLGKWTYFLLSWKEKEKVLKKKQTNLLMTVSKDGEELIKTNSIGSLL